MYSMASLTVAIFSASSSGTSMPKASSNAITNSTWSSESAPRSSTNDAVGVTSASSTPSCSTIICLTRSSTLAIPVPPRPVVALLYRAVPVPQSGGLPDYKLEFTCLGNLPILVTLHHKVNLGEDIVTYKPETKSPIRAVLLPSLNGPEFPSGTAQIQGAGAARRG